MTVVRELVGRMRWDTDRASMVRAERGVDRLRTKLGAAMRNANGMGSALRRMAVGFVGFTAISRFTRGLGEAIISGERLSSVLEAIEGDATKAAEALDFINSLAADMPFTIDQVTEAYTRLRGAGMQPTREQMMNLGNIAAAMQTDLESLVTAAQMAARGMPRHLEGILRTDIATGSESLSAQIDGETVEIERSFGAVLGFLEERGGTRFAGAVERQMNGIIGAYSNLGDAVTRFQRKIGESGLKDALTRLFRTMIKVTDSSEDLATTMGRALGNAVDGLTDAIIWLKTNSEDVKTVLTAIGGAAVSRALVGMAGMFLRSFALALSPVTILLAAIALIPLAIDDIVAFMSGRDSLLGSLLGDDADLIRGQLQQLGSSFKVLWEGAKAFVEPIGDLITAMLEPIGALLGAITPVEGVFGALGAALEVVGFGLKAMGFAMSVLTAPIRLLLSVVTELIELFTDLEGAVADVGATALGGIMEGFGLEGATGALRGPSRFDQAIAAGATPGQAGAIAGGVATPEQFGITIAGDISVVVPGDPGDLTDTKLRDATSEGILSGLRHWRAEIKDAARAGS